MCPQNYKSEQRKREKPKPTAKHKKKSLIIFFFFDYLHSHLYNLILPLDLPSNETAQRELKYVNKVWKTLNHQPPNY